MSKLFTAHNLVLIAMLSALAFILMFFEFPLPFLAPSFYELDFSELPVLIGAFSMGPVAGVIIEGLKIILKLLFKGTSTAYVGDLANFIVGCAFILPAGIIYKYKHTRKGALLGLIAGTLFLLVFGAIVNAAILLPWYAENFFGGMEPILEAGRAIWGAIDSVWMFAILIVVPFNLLKGVLVSTVTLLVYKHVSKLINGTLKKNAKK
ncbi:MAG: ECF transporter S component [Firmicutes bacterium]|nr:ECF transporter S component [Bacillota bacterium]